MQKLTMAKKTTIKVQLKEWHDYTIGTLDMLQACDACADMGMTYSVIVQCTDCVVFPKELLAVFYASCTMMTFCAVIFMHRHITAFFATSRTSIQYGFPYFRHFLADICRTTTPTEQYRNLPLQYLYFA